MNILNEELLKKFLENLNNYNHLIPYVNQFKDQ